MASMTASAQLGAAEHLHATRVLHAAAKPLKMRGPACMRSENGAGMRCYRAGQHSAAFRHFTEAARLCPGSAVHHANRASAALKLGSHDTALRDAECAAPNDSFWLL